MPLLVKDRCIGVMDLESPDYDAFGKHDVEVLSALASQVAVAIENARLYEALRANEERIERELQFARRVQAALLPAGLPKRMRGVDVAAHFTPARELGGDLHDFLSPESNSLVVAVGDVSGKGVPAALYSVFAAELVRSRTFRRRYMPERFSPAGVLMSINTILYERQLEGYYCTLCYAYFDLKRRTLTMANSGLPYTLRSTADTCLPIELPGLPLGSFPRRVVRPDRARAGRRRHLRVLHRRHLRDVQRGRRGVWRRARRRDRPEPPPRAGRRHRAGDCRRGRRLPRRRAARPTT